MKTRVISAVVLLAIIIPILIIGELPFKIFVSIISVLGLKELLSIRKNQNKTSDVMKIISYILIGLFVFFSSRTLNLDFKIILGLLLILMLPVVLINDNEKYNISDALYFLGSIIFLGLGFTAFIIVRDFSLANIIYLALITIMTDSFALFTGMFIGKHKLCEKISPKKTIEGAIGGSLIGTIVPTLFYIFVINSDVNIFLLVVVTFILTVIGQLGDLLFSSIKRYYGVKDFSKLIPGHGGILDRFDSLLLVTITYLLLIGIL